MPPTNGTSEGRFILKSGKLIRVSAIFEGDRIRDIKITGDFFLHPEERIEEIEQSLRNRRIDEVNDVVEREMADAEYEGISPETLTEAIRGAWMRRK